MNLAGLYSTISIFSRTYIFSSTQGILFRIEHLLSHKASLNKFTRIEIIHNFISDHTDMKLDINNIRNLGKSTET